MNNKVSEKAIWDNSVISDDETAFSTLQAKSQPQMMFCYKCNNVIPANSRFCPCCNIELYTTCPKCGIQYSSQYPVCNQCGTNRQEYLLLQRKELEKIEARKQEEKLQREKLEREKQEKEHQERLNKIREDVRIAQQKEDYSKENQEIMKTTEYVSLHSLFIQAFKAFDLKCSKMNYLLWGSMILPHIYLLFFGFVYDLANQNMELFFTILIILGLIMIFVGILCSVYRNSQSCRENYLRQYISSRNDYDKSLITSDLIKMINYQGVNNLSDCCIVAYRKKHGLNINYKWHSLS